jgi:LPXTG-site transpeptidase (sortase) family protein
MFKFKKSRILLAILFFHILSMSLTVFPSTAQAAVAVNPEWPYLRVWERTDWPVALGAVSRSWYWGPAPFAVTSEPYTESPNQLRRVQYWDKSRMEITRPNGNINDKWYVTNGLLVREMVTGNVQLGDDPYNTSYLGPANVPVSGDPAEFNDVSPTYSSFKELSSLALNNRAVQSRQPVNQVLGRNGLVTNDNSLASRYPETAPVYFENTLGHNIPGVLWNFMNQNGPVMVDRTLRNQVVEDWTFAFGFPITEAYWTRSIVGGIEKDVLVQLFERRALTYTPSNPTGFKVEMGNVGRHYYNWRYNTSTGISPVYAQPATRLVIPKLRIDTPVEYVGVLPNGDMDVPANPNNVAWYKYGARPGERGNAVIAGHRDYRGYGQVVFARLDQLRTGDQIYIITASGTRLTFEVTAYASYPAGGGPSDRIFGPSNSSNLNLITCTGTFDSSSASYNERLVVYTTLVS